MRVGQMHYSDLLAGDEPSTEPRPAKLGRRGSDVGGIWYRKRQSRRQSGEERDLSLEAWDCDLSTWKAESDAICRGPHDVVPASANTEQSARIQLREATLDQRTGERFVDVDLRVPICHSSGCSQPEELALMLDTLRSCVSLMMGA